MRKALLVLLMMMGCRGAPIETVKVEPEVIPTLMEGTVGLISQDEVVPYCTGVWISSEYILTAHHCVSRKLEDILEIEGLEIDPEKEIATIQLKEIKYIIKEDVKNAFEKPSIYRSAKVISLDPEDDLALLQAEGVIPMHPVIHLANKVKIGERLHIIGHVQGLSWTYMEGLASAERVKDGVSLLQVSAPIYFGVSGGGAFNQYGELVGITSFIYKAPNIGFFADINTIKKFLQKK